MGIFDKLFKRHSIPEKINFLGKEYELSPKAVLFSQSGIEKCVLEDYSGAVIDFTHAINAQPSNQNLYALRGKAYEDLGNDIEAEKDFRKTLEMEPSSYISAYRLGMIFFRKNDFENAIKWLKISHKNTHDGDLESLGLGRNNILYVAKKIISGNLGNFLTQVGKYEEGFKYLDEAIKLDPSYPNPYMAKGAALAQMGRPREGIPYLEKAEKLGITKASMLIQILKNM